MTPTGDASAKEMRMNADDEAMNEITPYFDLSADATNPRATVATCKHCGLIRRFWKHGGPEAYMRMLRHAQRHDPSVRVASSAGTDSIRKLFRI